MYPPFTDVLSYNFETKINSNIIFYDGYPCYSTKDNTLNCIKKEIWEIFNNNFPEVLTQVKYQKKTICNYFHFTDDLPPQNTNENRVQIEEEYNFLT